MARTDTRLVVAIVSTAILSGTVAALVATKLAYPDAPPPRPAPVAEPADCSAFKAALADCSLQTSVLELKLRDAARPQPPVACDEVSCVLNNYEGPCCQPYKRSPSSPPAATSLDRAQISAGVAAVRPQIQACGDRIADRGQVRVHVKVAPDGHVTSVDPREDNALGRCVADVIRVARFAKTDTGGSFGYPFVF